MMRRVWHSCGTKPFVIMGKRDSGATLAVLTLAAEAADRYPPMVTGRSRSSAVIS